jgi:hypothetical protein
MAAGEFRYSEGIPLQGLLSWKRFCRLIEYPNNNHFSSRIGLWVRQALKNTLYTVGKPKEKFALAGTQSLIFLIVRNCYIQYGHGCISFWDDSGHLCLTIGCGKWHDWILIFV